MADCAMTSGVGETSDDSSFGRFRATVAWHGLVAAVRTVACSGADGAFSGADVVSALHDHVRCNRENFGVAPIDKTTIVRLCQTMLSSRMLEPLDGTSPDVFSCSADHAYQFVEERSNLMCIPKKVSSVLASAEKPDISRASTFACRSFKSPYLTRRSGLSTGSDSQSLPDFPEDSTSCRSDLWSFPSTSTPCGKARNNCQRDVSAVSDDLLIENSQVDSETLFELALFQLLTLVEIPVLDGILQIRMTQSAKRFTLPNWLRVKRPKSDDKLLDMHYKSELVSSALVCLNGAVSLPKDFDLYSKLEQMSFLFNQVLKQKRDLGTDPLIPQEYADICGQVFRLISLGRHDQALEAIQLLLLLIPTNSRVQLIQILRLLKAASDTPALKLANDLSNLDVCLLEYTDLVLPVRQEFPPAHRRQFLEFLIMKQELVGEIPDRLRAELEQRAERRLYTVAEPQPLITYCEQTSAVEFDRQSVQQTTDSLVALANQIIDKTDMNLAAKRAWLGRFRSMYPKVYADFFADLGI